VILMTGATGFVGRHVLRHLLAQPNLYPIGCLLTSARGKHLYTLPQVRDVLPADGADGVLKVFTGSLRDEETLFRALTGVDVIIHLEGAQWWGRTRDLERVELEGTRALLAAARAARVGRIIALSHLGASPASAFALLRIKGQVEELIRASGLAYTILRSGLAFGEEDTFVNYLAMQLRALPFVFLMPGQGEVVLHPIYIDDLARAICGCLEAIDTVDNVIDIGGAEYVSVGDMMRTIMRVSGAQRLLIAMPPYALRAAAEVYSRVLPRALISPQWFDLITTNKTAPLGNLYRYFGFQPRRFEDTLAMYMRGRRYGLEMLRESFRRRRA
jgi:NADH dehydrogenase